VRDLIAAADLLIGAACPGCGTPALAVCASCARTARPAPFAVATARRAQHLGVAAAGRHEGALQRIVVDWKEHGRFPLTHFLAHHLAAAVVAGVDAEALTLVPVPTSWSARWRRGDDLVLALARSAGALLSQVGHDVAVQPVLRRARRTADQAGLGAADRARNLEGAFAVSRAQRLSPGRLIVIVDDVVTTGSTLAEAARALSEGGWNVHRAATVAATSR